MPRFPPSTVSIPHSCDLAACMLAQAALARGLHGLSRLEASLAHALACVLQTVPQE